MGDISRGGYVWGVICLRGELSGGVSFQGGKFLRGKKSEGGNARVGIVRGNVSRVGEVW